MSNIVTIGVFLLAAWGIWLLSLSPRIRESLVPAQMMVSNEADSPDIQRSLFENDEVPLKILNVSVDSDSAKEQIVVYRLIKDIQNYAYDAPVYLAYVDFDEIEQLYSRQWTVMTDLIRPNVTAEARELTGDGTMCILLTGTTSTGNRILTIYKSNPERTDWTLIGNIPATASPALSRNGQLIDINIRGPDPEALSPLDQIETRYRYNASLNRYEQDSRVKIPGERTEQLQLQAVLNGGHAAAETFLAGLWNYDQAGTMGEQYLSFDPSSREIIFFGDDVEQIFVWQTSTSTRTGLSLFSSNISVRTLARSLEIEFVSVDSIRVRVTEDAKLRMRLPAWDGLYRRTATQAVHVESIAAIPSVVNARYQGAIGRLNFSADGTYEQISGSNVLRGRYAFFSIDSEQVLELRPDSGARELYAATFPDTQTLRLNRIRLGAHGIQSIHESVITLTMQK